MTTTIHLNLRALRTLLWMSGGALLVFAALLLFSPFSAQALLVTDLDFGDTGADVTELQTFLATDASLYPEGLVTGYFASLTRAAVQRFQCRQSIVCSGSAETTGYGRVGPQTRAALNAAIGGGSGGTGGPGTFGDIFAPIMSPEIIVVLGGVTTTTSPTIPRSLNMIWNTSEPARSRVMYGLNFPFLYATAPSFSDATLDTTSNIILTNLLATTTYFYVRESVDASGNVQWTAPANFRTP